MSRVPQSATRFAASAKNRRASALLALGLAFAMPGLASACRCLDPGPAAPAYSKASVVLTGTVLRVRTNADATVTATVRVAQSWKQSLSGEVELSTVATTCAFPFAEGGRYVFFARQQPTGPGIYTARCMGSADIGQSTATLEWLRRHGRPKQDIVSP